MKITRIETAYLRVPLWLPYQRGVDFASGKRAPARTGSLVVKLHADSGIYGLGDILIKGGNDEEARAFDRFVHSRIAPLLVGQDALDREPLVRSVRAAAGIGPLTAGIDIALHDLAGKVLGVPIYRLLGGRFRQKIALAWNVPAGSLEEMIGWTRKGLEMGFANVVKVKTGGPDDVAILAAIQKVAGEVPLRPDDNGAFPAEESIIRFRRARELGVRYELLEQPAPNRDLSGLREVATALGVPVMYHVGHVPESHQLDIIRLKAADAVSVPVIRHGFLEAKRLMEAFEIAGIGCLMGSALETSIGATAALHLATAVANVIHPIDTLGHLWMVEDILVESPVMREGYGVAPDGPGLGIKLDQAKVDKYRVAL